MREVIEKYFTDGRCKYYHPADLIADEHYIAYQFNGNMVIISAGCNEGEIPLFVCNNPEYLEAKIKALIY